MNRKGILNHWIMTAGLVALLVCLLAAFFPTDGALASTAKPSAADASAEKGNPQGAAPGSLYAAEPKPMTVAECGRCHPSQYQALREHGGAHRFDCRDCHQVFHAYNPRRKNYAQIMPHCTDCHEAPHGKKEVKCLGCHVNPHAPLLTFSMPVLAKNCAVCHQDQASQLHNFPSAHSQQACQSCHSKKHGRIPACSECHSPHYPGQAQASCTACHPPHRPLNITFAPDAEAKICATCHDGVYAKWSTTKSRHGKVNCTICHVKHGSIPACTDCHTPPHDPKMMARFKSCLGCHMDAHDLPTK